MAARGILFDFDGTLANTTHLILATFHQTLDHFVPANQVDDQTIINTFGLPLRDGLAGITGCTDPEEMDRMVASRSEGGACCPAPGRGPHGHCHQQVQSQLP